MSLRAPILIVTAWARTTCGAAKNAAPDASRVLRSIRVIRLSRWKIATPAHSNSCATRGRAFLDLAAIAFRQDLPDLPAYAQDLSGAARRPRRRGYRLITPPQCAARHSPRAARSEGSYP